MLNFETARKLLADQVVPLAGIELDLAAAFGCRLAETPRAETDLPATDVSTMDGYAVRATDLADNTDLPVAFEVPAGQVPQQLSLGAAARIFTGAMLPDGADTIVPQEQARVQADGRILLDRLEPGSFVRHQAELCSAGTPLGAPGDLLTPQLLALLGTAGVSTVHITPRPRIAVLSTGSELVPVHERPAPGQIRDSNSITLAALARTAGFTLSYVSSVMDELPALRDAFQHAAAQADLIISCGGVSVGDYDLVPQALSELGSQTVFHKLSIKPGKPVLAARLDETWVIGLPGNPISALVDWRLFARPLGEALAGAPHAFEELPESAVLTEPARNSGNRTIFAPARLQPDRPISKINILPWKGSHDVVTLAQANALAILDVGVELAAGDLVNYFRLDADNGITSGSPIERSKTAH